MPYKQSTAASSAKAAPTGALPVSFDRQIVLPAQVPAKHSFRLPHITLNPLIFIAHSSKGTNEIHCKGKLRKLPAGP
jgi:hypothetical protein